MYEIFRASIIRKVGSNQSLVEGAQSHLNVHINAQLLNVIVSRIFNCCPPCSTLSFLAYRFSYPWSLVLGVERVPKSHLIRFRTFAERVASQKPEITNLWNICSLQQYQVRLCHTDSCLKVSVVKSPIRNIRWAIREESKSVIRDQISPWLPCLGSKCIFQDTSSKLLTRLIRPIWQSAISRRWV